MELMPTYMNGFYNVLWSEIKLIFVYWNKYIFQYLNSHQTYLLDTNLCRIPDLAIFVARPWSKESHIPGLWYFSPLSQSDGLIYVHTESNQSLQRKLLKIPGSIVINGKFFTDLNILVFVDSRNNTSFKLRS